MKTVAIVLETEAQLERAPFLGPLFEGFVASEIVKGQMNAGRRRELYHSRDQQGLEVDFLVPVGGQAVALVEAKASRSITPDAAPGLDRLAAAMSGRATTRMVVSRTTALDSSALRPGTTAVTLPQLLAALHGTGTRRGRQPDR